MAEFLSNIGEIDSKGIEKLSDASEQIKSKVEKLDKPLNTDNSEDLIIDNMTEDPVNDLDKPLTDETPELGLNELSKELSEKISEMLTNEGIDKLREEYPNLDKELNKIQLELQNAETPAERYRASNKLEQVKGRAMEVMLKDALAEYFDSVDEKQISVETDEGVTKPDIILSNAKNDITIGSTEISQGQDLGVEVKCGADVYIRSQISHILTQVLGHGENSVVIVSSEYNDMTSNAKGNLLNGLEERNSSLCVLDISSSDVRNALHNNIKSKE